MLYERNEIQEIVNNMLKEDQITTSEELKRELFSLNANVQDLNISDSFKNLSLSNLTFDQLKEELEYIFEHKDEIYGDEIIDLINCSEEVEEQNQRWLDENRKHFFTVD